jgi:hypothetical protein
MEMVMKKFMFAQRFKISDFTQLSDMPWISNQSFIIEASSSKEAWMGAVEKYKDKYDFLKTEWACKEVTPSDSFFQNSWVKFFLHANRGITI